MALRDSWSPTRYLLTDACLMMTNMFISLFETILILETFLEGLTHWDLNLCDSLVNDLIEAEIKSLLPTYEGKDSTLGLQPVGE